MGRHIPGNEPMKDNQLLAQGHRRGPLDLGDRWQEFMRSFERSRHRLFCDISAIFAVLMFIVALGAIAALANAGEVWFLAALCGTWAGSAVVVCYLIKRVRIPHGPGIEASESSFTQMRDRLRLLQRLNYVAVFLLCTAVWLLHYLIPSNLAWGVLSTLNDLAPDGLVLKVIAFILLAAICGSVVWSQRTSRRTKSFAELWRDYRQIVGQLMKDKIPTRTLPL